jgi:hypothetical protein
MIKGFLQSITPEFLLPLLFKICKHDVSIHKVKDKAKAIVSGLLEFYENKVNNICTREKPLVRDAIVTTIYKLNIFIVLDLSFRSKLNYYQTHHLTLGKHLAQFGIKYTS